MEHRYDYIILGSGASGLLLAYRLDRDPYFSEKSILIIDREAKDTNDRTWCFWEEGPGEWDSILSHEWGSILFRSQEYGSDIAIEPYRYKMVRSAAFYSRIKNSLSDKVYFLVTQVTSWKETGQGAEVITDAGRYECRKLFSSIPAMDVNPKTSEYPYLHQHFVGWFIQTPGPVFNPEVATFMDFTIDQKGNTRFMYVLPYAANKALVEYTMFSASLLTSEEYESGIREYLTKQGLSDYTILEKETGDIPMTCYPFWRHNSAHIMYIGSAGGWTNAATGYTFMNTVRTTLRLRDFLKKHDDLSAFRVRGRHWFYDLIFLDVLWHNNASGSNVFSSVFKNNDIRTVLRFLDETSGILEDLGVLFATSPKINFIKSAIRNFPRIIHEFVRK